MSHENVKKVIINMILAVFGAFSFIALTIISARMISELMPAQFNRIDNTCVKIKQGPFEKVECHESYIHPHDPPESTIIEDTEN